MTQANDYDAIAALEYAVRQLEKIIGDNRTPCQQPCACTGACLPEWAGSVSEVCSILLKTKFALIKENRAPQSP